MMQIFIAGMLVLILVLALLVGLEVLKLEREIRNRSLSLAGGLSEVRGAVDELGFTVGDLKEIRSAVSVLGYAVGSLKDAAARTEEGLEDLGEKIGDLKAETVRSVNGLDDLYLAVSELEKAAKGDPEAGGEADQLSPAMLEGFDNLMSYTEKTARGERP